jgi:HTH-type transcriptional regulator/antitoxin HipB
MKTNSEIASLIRFHRKKSGLSQEALAKLAGVGKTVVFDAEKGKESIQLDTVKKIFRILNITMKFESPLMALYEREKSQ